MGKLGKPGRKINASFGLDKEELQVTLIDIFNFFHGTFPYFYQILLTFPEFLIQHWKAFTEIMIKDGPLSIEERLMIGIMVKIVKINSKGKYFNEM